MLALPTAAQRSAQTFQHVAGWQAKRDKMKPEDPDELPPELEELYDPDETFKINATPEEAARVLVCGNSA